MNDGHGEAEISADRVAPRVVLICLHADPATPAGVGEGGGTHSYLRELLHFLGRRGTDHMLLTRWANPEAPEMQRTSSCGWLRRLRIGAPGPLDKRLLAGLHATTVAAVSEALDEFGSPDLLHSVYWNSGQAAMDVAAERGLAFVHTVISNGWRREASGQRDQPAVRVAIERRVFHAARRIFLSVLRSGTISSTAMAYRRRGSSSLVAPWETRFERQPATCSAYLGVALADTYGS